MRDWCFIMYPWKPHDENWIEPAGGLWFGLVNLIFQFKRYSIARVLIPCNWSDSDFWFLPGIPKSLSLNKISTNVVWTFNTSKFKVGLSAAILYFTIILKISKKRDRILVRGKVESGNDIPLKWSANNPTKQPKFCLITKRFYIKARLALQYTII